MKPNKIAVISLAALLGIGVATGITLGTNNKVADNNNTTNNNDTNDNEKNLIISNNQPVVKFIEEQDFDPAEVLSFEVGTTVTEKNSASGADNPDGSLTVTKKTVCDALSGTGDINSVVQSAQLYPGQVLKADKNLVEGHPTELSNLDRGQTKFYIDLPELQNNTFTVDETTIGAVNTAITQKVNLWNSLGKTLTVNQESHVTQTFSSQQLDVTLGFGLASKLDISAEYKQEGEQNIFIVSYEQIFYSVVTDMGNDTVVFADNVLRPAVEAECTDAEGNPIPPVIIKQANYGKALYFKVQTTKSLSEITAAFSYAGSVDVDAKAQFNEELSTCEVSCLIMGGSAGSYSSLSEITGDNKGEQITNLLVSEACTTTVNASNSVLLSYQTNFLKNNEFAQIQSTTKYVQTTYETIHYQHVELYNAGGFEVSRWEIKGCQITGYNQDTGEPIYGNEEIIQAREHIPVCQGNTYDIPAKYGKLRFAYDIKLGSDWPFNDYIALGGAYFEKAEIKTCGTTYNNTVELTVDGSFRKI